MSATEQEFDLSIWIDLLKKFGKTNETPTVRWIANAYGVSRHIANAYRFAFLNRWAMDKDPSIEHNIKLAYCRDDNHNLRVSNKSLFYENGQLKAQIDFLMALKTIDAEAIKPIKIGISEKMVEECTVYTALSDAHMDEVVEPATVKFINEFNPDIAKARIRRYFKRSVWMVRQLRLGGWNIQNYVQALLGDLISGYIHEELMENNSMSPTEAVIFVSELLVEGIKTLVNETGIDNIKIICIRGNHSRTSVRKKYSTGYKNSYEFMMYTQLKQMFDIMPGYENVEFIIPKSEFQLIEIYDKSICNSHGDHFNYRGGVGGVEIPFKGWIYKMQRILPADKYSIAHWHQYYNSRSGMINGSLIGYNAFAMGHAFEPEDPQMQFQIIDSKRGFTINTPIKLVDW